MSGRKAMSRAFIREDGGGEGDDLPELPLSSLPNYVTPRGLARLKERLEELNRLRESLLPESADLHRQRRLRETERDIRYYRARVDSAIPVDPSAQPPGEVRLGSEVEVQDEEGALRVYSIVGEDEADAGRGLLFWNSPLASALIGAKAGDSVAWRTPQGTRRLLVRAVRRPA